MALAQRLNELALANSDGLLSDEEYRLLRQNLFDQYSDPIEPPDNGQRLPVNPGYNSPKSRMVFKPINPTAPQQTSSITSVLVKFFRKATDSKVSRFVNDLAPTKRMTINTPFNKSVVFDDNNRIQRIASTSHPVRVLKSSNPTLPSFRTSNTPTVSSVQQPFASLSIETSMPLVRDIFEDDNLTTAKDIFNVISATEEEARKLVNAFDDLEANTARRLQKQKTQRRSKPAPLNLIPHQEQREHRLALSPSTPQFDSKQPLYLETCNDGISIRSVSSNITSLSQSKSFSVFPKLAPSSLLSSYFGPSSPRKYSLSSASSQGASQVSDRKFGDSQLLPNPIYNGKLNTGSGIISPEAEESVQNDNREEDSGLLDIRKHRQELITRYSLRLEFLRAKLKSAELHEKLLRN